jgi:hypothetical protein
MTSAFLCSAHCVDCIRRRRPIEKLIRDLDICKFFRGDAAFAIPELYELLEASQEQENARKSPLAKLGRGRDVKLENELRLEQFQAQPKWEIPARIRGERVPAHFSSTQMGNPR